MNEAKAIMKKQALAYPDVIAARMTDIGLENLRGMGVRGLILDLDNTLALWQAEEIAPGASVWCARAREMGMKLLILSNNHEKRVRSIAEKIGAAWVADARKPTKRAYARALYALGLPAVQCAAIGDQYFTDILGAKRAGIKCALVNPLGKKELLYTRCVRVFERFVLAYLGIERP